MQIKSSRYPDTRRLAMAAIEDLRSRLEPYDGLVDVRAGEWSWDNPLAWRFWYRSVYEDGLVDSRVKGRAFVAATEHDALVQMGRIEAGFGAIKVLLYGVEGPRRVTPGIELDRINRELRQSVAAGRGTRDARDRKDERDGHGRGTGYELRAAASRAGVPGVAADRGRGVGRRATADRDRTLWGPAGDAIGAGAA